MSPDTAKQSLLWAWVHRSQNHPEGGLEIVFHPSHPSDSKLKSVQSIRKSPYHPSQNRSETAGLMHGVVLDWLQTMALKTRFWFECKNDSRGPVWLRNSPHPPPPPMPCNSALMYTHVTHTTSPTITTYSDLLSFTFEGRFFFFFF